MGRHLTVRPLTAVLHRMALLNILPLPTLAGVGAATIGMVLHAAAFHKVAAQMQRGVAQSVHVNHLPNKNLLIFLILEVYSVKILIISPISFLVNSGLLPKYRP